MPKISLNLIPIFLLLITSSHTVASASVIEQSRSNIGSVVSESEWREVSEPYRDRAYPQIAPFAIYFQATNRFDVAAEEILVWRKQGFISDFLAWNNVEDRAHLRNFRWKKAPGNVSDSAFPRFQRELTFGRDVNALRAAWALRATGDHYRQLSWQPRADALVTYLLLQSETGFPLSVTESGNRVEADTDSAAATAYWALHWIEDFPQNPHTPGLLKQVERVLVQIVSEPKRSAVKSALVAKALRGGQCAVLNQSIFDRYLAEPIDLSEDHSWGLELAYQMTLLSEGKPPGWTQSIVDKVFERQICADLSTRVPTFGAFQGVGPIGQDNARVAASLAKLATVADEPYWLDRAAFALRAQCGIWATLAQPSHELLEGSFAGLAWPGFGNERQNEPDRRDSWEQAEGLFASATWEILQAAGSYTQFSNRQLVGIEGITINHDGDPADVFRGNPHPFDRATFFGWRNLDSGAFNPVANLVSIPRITEVRIETRDGKRILLASPGISLVGINREDVRVSARIGVRPLLLRIGLEGYEWLLPPISRRERVTVDLEYQGRIKSTTLVVEPEG